MKSYVLFLVLLQSLRCSGVPRHNSELESMASQGLEASLVEVNSMYAVNNLYRVTRGTVKRVIPLGSNTLDMMMAFTIKESECTKASRADPMTCAFRPGFFVPTFSCSSRVRMSAASTQVLSVRCGRDDSSSSESSEERSMGRQSFNIPLAKRVPSPPAPPSSGPRRSLLSPMEAEPAHRGDAFNNFVV